MSKVLKSIGFFAFLIVAFVVLLVVLLLITSKPEVSAIVAGLVSVIGGILKSKFSAIKAQLERETRLTVELKKRLAGPRFALPEKSKERYVRVAIAGLGGTGKTSLIRKASGCKLADPRMKTGSAKTYSIVREIAYEERTDVCRIDMEDYRGQNASELLENIRISEDTFPVTALLMMVDLFEADEDRSATSDNDAKALWDQARVDKHIREWSDQLIGVLLDSLTDVKYISLFINKADLVNAPIAAVEKEVKSLFTPILNSIKARSADRLVRVFVGSAVTDRMISTQVSEWTEDASVILT